MRDRASQPDGADVVACARHCLDLARPRRFATVSEDDEELPHEWVLALDWWSMPFVVFLHADLRHALHGIPPVDVLLVDDVVETKAEALALLSVVQVRDPLGYRDALRATHVTTEQPIELFVERYARLPY
jgi:hypothetical protein